MFSFQAGSKPDSSFFKPLCNPKHLPCLFLWRHQVPRLRNFFSKNDHETCVREKVYAEDRSLSGRLSILTSAENVNSLLLEKWCEIHFSYSPLIRKEIEYEPIGATHIIRFLAFGKGFSVTFHPVVPRPLRDHGDLP